MQLGYAEDPEAWLNHLVRRGGMAEVCKKDVLLGRPSYLDDQVRQELDECFVAHGLIRCDPTGIRQTP